MRLDLSTCMIWFYIVGSGPGVIRVSGVIPSKVAEDSTYRSGREFLMFSPCFLKSLPCKLCI